MGNWTGSDCCRTTLLNWNYLLLKRDNPEGTKVCETGPYEVSTVPRRLITRSNAWLIFVFVAFTVAFDSFIVPSRTIEPSSFAAFRVAALRRPAFSTRTVQRQY